jgi:GMP synthase (glutamine-hydrolysing)
VVPLDFPFLGACYGVGTLGLHQGAAVDRTYGEPVGTAWVELTAAGRADPITAGIPDGFAAFVGHKEAVRELPRHAVLLAGSADCPVQMFRIKRNLYATQFHPELDQRGLATRIRIYREAGYFPPHQAEELIDRVMETDAPWPPWILRNFVERYG